MFTGGQARLGRELHAAGPTIRKGARIVEHPTPTLRGWGESDWTDKRHGEVTTQASRQASSTATVIESESSPSASHGAVRLAAASKVSMNA